MKKELIICVIIIIAIIIGNYITQNYTKKWSKTLSDSLQELRQELLKDEEQIDNNMLKNKSEEITNEWNSNHNKLAYYIEHKELEKVEIDLISMKSYIDSSEYKESVNELDKCIFVIKHIEDMYAFNLENVF